MIDGWSAMLFAAIALAAVAAALAALHRAERRRAAAWHRWYFHGGGLIRTLMARWSQIGVARLTDQRSREAEHVLPELAGTQPQDHNSS